MANVTVIFTHPSFNRTETLDMPDDRMAALADLLRTLEYSQEGIPPSSISRGKAVEYFAKGMIRSVRETYRRLKDQEAKAAIPPSPEIDA